MKHTQNAANYAAICNVTLVLKCALVPNLTVGYYPTVEAARAAAFARKGFDSAVIYDEANRLVFRSRRWFGKGVN